jgi:hypothetical protein
LDFDKKIAVPKRHISVALQEIGHATSNFVARETIVAHTQICRATSEIAIQEEVIEATFQIVAVRQLNIFKM